MTGFSISTNFTTRKNAMPVRNFPAIRREKIARPRAVGDTVAEMDFREGVLANAVANKSLPIGKREEARFRLDELRAWKSQVERIPG
jgi:hypothetical protein